MPQQFEPQETTGETLIPAMAEEVPVSSLTSEEVLDEAAIDSLFLKAAQKLKRRKRRLWGFFLLGEAGIFLLVGLIHFLGKLGVDVVWLWTCFAFLIINIVIFVTATTRIQSDLEFDPEELARLGDVRALPLLLNDIMPRRKSKHRQQLDAALALLLPQLKASDASRITSKQRRSLYAILKNYGVYDAAKDYPEELVVALIKALEQIGDTRAIRYVEELARISPNNESEQRIQQAAQECLPYLQANAGFVTEQQTLLRPSSAENASPDTLLRPAHFTDDAPVAELLRASNARDEA